MPKVASARVHGLYGDPVKGMALKQLESAALTQPQEACRPGPSDLEMRSRSGALLRSLQSQRRCAGTDLELEACAQSDDLVGSIGEFGSDNLRRLCARHRQASARICGRSPRSETDESYESFAADVNAQHLRRE